MDATADGRRLKITAATPAFAAIAFIVALFLAAWGLANQTHRSPVQPVLPAAAKVAAVPAPLAATPQAAAPAAVAVTSEIASTPRVKHSRARSLAAREKRALELAFAVPADQAAPARPDFAANFAPLTPKAPAAASAQPDAAAPELARAPADTHPVAVGPQVQTPNPAVPVATIQHAVQRDDGPPVIGPTTALEHVSDVHVLSDQELAGVSAASGGVATTATAMTDGVPGV